MLGCSLSSLLSSNRLAVSLVTLQDVDFDKLIKSVLDGLASIRFNHSTTELPCGLYGMISVLLHPRGTQLA